jgi:hypothetical protein
VTERAGCRRFRRGAPGQELDGVAGATIGPGQCSATMVRCLEPGHAETGKGCRVRPLMGVRGKAPYSCNRHAISNDTSP